MTDYEPVCVSSDPQKVVEDAQGTYFSSFLISVKGEEGSGETFTCSKALKGYLDVRLGNDTPEARDRQAFLRLKSALKSRSH